jgi:hypothetical protein
VAKGSHSTTSAAKAGPGRYASLMAVLCLAWPSQVGDYPPADNSRNLGYNVWEIRPRLAGGIMRALAILIAAVAMHFGVRDAALAQSSTPNVTPPFTGLSTPLTSTTTNCMGSCNGQFANCQSSCIVRRLPPGTLVRDPNLSGGDVSAAGSCISFCTTQQISCQTVCANASPSR